MQTVRRPRAFRAILLSSLAAAVCPALAQAQGEPVEAARDRAAISSDGLALKRLPADRDGMMFRGESESRAWPVFMTRQEADKIGEFRLAIVNAVSVLPERSTLRLTVNGRVLAAVPVRSPGKTSLLSVRIPPGVLVPGFNSVAIATVLSHRVDCSLKATYELWTLVDPALTGFVIPAATSASGRTVADIAGEPIPADGTTRIHVRLPDRPDADTVGRASRLVTRIVAEAHIARPLVDVGPAGGEGPGVDIAFKGSGAAQPDLAAMRVLLRRPDLILARDPASERLLVVGADESEAVPSQVEPATGDVTALAVLGRQSGTQLSGPGRIRFDDLGLADDAFSGRHYLRDVRLRLPSDFYPGNYDKVRLLLDGGYAGDLDAQSSLVFRVNGALVSTLKLRGGTAGRFQHETIELPLRFFRPGSNDIAIEGALSTAGDATCDPAAKPDSSRLFIAGSSEVDIPYLAHLGTMPQIAGALPADGGGQGEAHDVYILDAGAGAIGSALTVAANLAAQSSTAPNLHLHFTAPGLGDRPGIVLGVGQDLPVRLTRALDRVTEAKHSASDAPPGAAGRHPATGWLDRAETWFRERGFFFTAAPDAQRRISTDERTLLVASVRPDEGDLRVAGVDLPRFTGDPRQWLVFTAKTPDAYQAGLNRLVADGLWPRLNGEAVALGVDDGKFASVEAGELTYVLPQAVRPGDIRPIIGGLMSSNIVLSAVLAILMLALLGMTTHGLLRSGKGRPR